MKEHKRNNKLVIKLVFGLALLLFIGWKISSSLAADDFSQLKTTANINYLLLLAMFLMPFNWLIETVKWHLLMKTIKPQPFKHTLLNVLAGISTSLLTPNRIGNFIGRTINLDRDLRTKAVVATIHSNLAQFTASILFGFFGLLYMDFSSDYVSNSGLRISALVVILLSFLIYYNPKLIDFSPLSKMYSEQLKDGIKLVQNESVVLKTKIILLSLLRYLVYLTQFYILLACFESDLEYQMIIPAIAVVYLITTIIPSFLFGKLFVREVSALFVLTAFDISTPVILATVFILWLINLAIPSLIGGFVLMRAK